MLGLIIVVLLGKRMVVFSVSLSLINETLLTFIGKTPPCPLVWNDFLMCPCRLWKRKVSRLSFGGEIIVFWESLSVYLFLSFKTWLCKNIPSLPSSYVSTSSVLVWIPALRIPSVRALFRGPNDWPHWQSRVLGLSPSPVTRGSFFYSHISWVAAEPGTVVGTVLGIWWEK